MIIIKIISAVYNMGAWPHSQATLARVLDRLQYAKTKRSKTGAGEGLGTRLWE